MKGHDLEAVGVLTFQFGVHALLHFFRSVIGIGKGQNFVRTCVAFADQVGDPLRENGCLTGAGSRHHQHRAMDVLDGLPLALVGLNFRG